MMNSLGTLVSVVAAIAMFEYIMHELEMVSPFMFDTFKRKLTSAGISVAGLLIVLAAIWT